MSETDCVFCKLISGELEVSVIYQDELCLALMDIQPVTPGHALVVPRRHAAYLADLDAEDGAQMFRVAQRVAAAVFHVHLHVFPRYSGDGLGLKLPADYHDRPPREELNQLAQKIRLALG